MDWSEATGPAPTPRPRSGGSGKLLVILGVIGLGAALSVCCVAVAAISVLGSKVNGKCPACGHEQYVRVLEGAGNSVQTTRCQQCGQSFSNLTWHSRYEVTHEKQKDTGKK